MERQKLLALGVAAAMGLLSAAGCCEKEKKQLVALTQDYNELSNRNKELREELAGFATREQALKDKLSATESELTAAKDEVASLKEKLTAGAGTGAKGEWERGLVGDRISVGSDILFSSGRATLTAAGKGALGKIAADLKGSYAGLPVRVSGYTDNDPIKKTKKLWADNLDLSANRAMAVSRYLISQGIDADRIETIAMGMTHPVASNATKAGKAKNRRVEIIVIKQK